MKNKHIWITLFLVGMNILLVGVHFARGQDEDNDNNNAFTYDAAVGNSWSDHQMKNQITDYYFNFYRFLDAGAERGASTYLGFGIISKQRVDLPRDSVFSPVSVPIAVAKIGIALNQYIAPDNNGPLLNVDFGWPLSSRNECKFYFSVTGRFNYEVKLKGRSRMGVFLEAGGAGMTIDRGGRHFTTALIAKAGLSYSVAMPQ